MTKTVLTLVLILFFNAFLNGQSISGTLTQLMNQPIKLEGFNGFKTYPISSSSLDEKGNFKLTYSKADYGAGYLISVDEKPLLVILNGEDVEIIVEALSYTETIRITKGRENIWFEQYAKEHPLREQALSAWVYLEKIYSQDSLFRWQDRTLENIQTEKLRIKAEDAAYLAKLPKESYVSWFLPTRKLISSVSTVAQYRPDEIPATILAFRTMDFTDQRLYRSGLFKDAVESHFWLLENCGKPLDSVFLEMQYSIDIMMENLIKDEKKFNEVTDFLFGLLERHSLFQASEYLALKVLNEVSCTIDKDLAKQLESYRAMKKGNTALDIIFTGDKYAPGYGQKNTPNKLSDLKSNYILIIFGASWCQKCVDELPEIIKYYSKWKAHGVEVVFISLDEEKEIFKNFTSIFPFISFCDYQKCNSTAAKDYHVFGTPTMYLLNERREILLRPNSVSQIDSWVNWNLEQSSPSE